MKDAASTGLVIKKSNIRIWIHQRNLGHLQQVVWEGHGSTLLVEHSNNAKIRKFLEAIPYIMCLIKDIHSDVINDDLESLKSRLEPPVPPIVLSGKDSNGLTPLHKAAGLGRQEIAEFIAAKYPRSVNLTDVDGRTPLHYAALLKDDGKMNDFLIEFGADESALDNKQKTAGYYKTRNSEIDAKVLVVIPECPRTAKDTFPPSWDWNLLTASTPVDNKKPENIFGNDTANQIERKLEQLKDLPSPTKEHHQSAHQRQKTAEENNNGGNEDEGNAAEESPEEKQNQDEGHEGDDGDENANQDEEDRDQQEEFFVNERVSSRPNSGTVEGEDGDEDHPKTRPGSQMEAEDNTRSRSRSSRPASEMANKSRPGSEMLMAGKSRPGSEMLPNKSRPGSEMAREDTPRPPSEIQERKSRPASEMLETRSRTRPSSRFEGHQNSFANDDDDENGVVEAEEVIEGVVNGENEIETLNEEGQDTNKDAKADDPEVLALIETGNMEQLAALVLEGEGERLVGYQSDNTELQSFLENVPVYMSKINRIHVAARNGSLKDLQAALDRRKFAIAKDNISPNGASPLHVATVFGNTSIVRYLAGRFPETLTVIDSNGRTPLHYAAVVADNGHYYNLLVHLGANNKTEDNFGNTPEHYRANQEEFSHKHLLRSFGAEEDVADEMLVDKVPDDTCSARKDLDDEDMISVLERCFNVLHGRRSSNAISATSTTTTSSTGVQHLSLLGKHMKRYVFDEIKLRLTKLDHNLYDVIWPSVKKLPNEQSFRLAMEQDFSSGVVAPDCYSYAVFHEFFIPFVKDLNCIDLHLELHDHPASKFVNVEPDSGEETKVDVSLDLDPSGKWIISGTLECTRNFEDYEFPKSLNVGQLEDVERLLTNALLSKQVAKTLYPNASDEEIDEKGSGTYYTMNEVLEDPSEAKVILAANGLLIPLWNIADSERLHGKHWPYGRGVYISNNGNLAAWINVLDHLRIVTCTPHQKPGNVGKVYSRICRLMACLSNKLNFKRDQKLGYLSSRPTCLGNTLQFGLTVRFPHLIKDIENLKHLCSVRALTFHRNLHASDVVRIGNQQCLGVTEMQTFEDFTTAVANILQLEKDLSMSNSLHIAALFLNIFRRKKTVTVDDC